MGGGAMAGEAMEGEIQGFGFVEGRDNHRKAGGSHRRKAIPQEQILWTIEIMEPGQLGHPQPGPACSLQGLGQHAIATPGNILKHLKGKLAKTNEVIAPIPGRPHHQIMIRQMAKGLAEDRPIEIRAINANDHHPLTPSPKSLSKRRLEAVTQIPRCLLPVAMPWDVSGGSFSPQPLHHSRTIGSCVVNLHLPDPRAIVLL